jgi:hypothetical protein
LCSFSVGWLFVLLHHHAEGGINDHQAVKTRSTSGAIQSTGNQNHHVKVYQSLLGASGNGILSHTSTSYHVSN